MVPLGKGGMGEVYRARDERIGREVAIKFLPASFAESPERLARFEQEARSAGALNHPNLVTIHELGRHGDAPYIVMELLDGAPLRALLAAGAGDGSPIPPRKAVEIAIQVARGLGAAHGKGLVHRDLKPENIFLVDDGQVKILDFGLARQLSSPDRSGETRTVAATDPGAVLGTIGYMAPEQVRGQALDARADLFAFGTVLFEMVTGTRAFHGDTAADTMTAILTQEPPAGSRPDLSPALDRIIRHCLEKNANERFQSARDVAFALGHLSSSAGQSAALDTLKPPVSRAPRAALLAAVCGVVLGIGAGWLMFRDASRSAPSDGSGAIPPQILRPLTFSGHDLSPAVSPDGKMVAFISSRDGRARVWLRQIDGGGELALTEGLDSSPSWSPDGSSVLFVRQNIGGTFSILRVPALGGTPRKIADGGEARWSPDGRTIAFLRTISREDGYDTAVLTVGADGTGLKEIARLRDLGATAPRWSPDGTRIAVGDASPGYRNRRPTLVRLDGTVEELDVLENQGLHSNVVWLDDSRILIAEFISTTYAPSGTGSRVVVRNLTTGESRVLLYTPEPTFSIDVTADGRFVADLLTARQNLNEITLPGVTPAIDRWLTRGHSHDRQPAYSRDGKKVVFSSTMSGNLDLWSVSTSDGALTRLTEDLADDFDPAYSPDGRSIIWSSRRSGNYEIWIADADGSNARQLTRDGIDAENPTMTADGRWVVYNSYNPAHSGIWKIRTDGSDASRISTDGTAQLPEVSPDGKWVAYSTSMVGERALRVVGIDGGEIHTFATLFHSGSSVLAGNFSPGRARWSADGRAIVYLDCDAAGACGLRQQDFDFGRDTTSTSRAIGRFDMFAPVESFSMAPDGTRVVVSTREQTERIVITDPIGMLARR
jgi:eukaryotic-like serine/threonine-protein kinase